MATAKENVQYAARDLEGNTVQGDDFFDVTMGDIRINEVSSKLAEEIAEATTGDKGNAKAVAFASETPAHTEPGTYEGGNVLFIKATNIDTSTSALTMGAIDGDTITFDLGNVEAPENTKTQMMNDANTAVDKMASDLKVTFSGDKLESVYKDLYDTEASLKVRFLGINAPEVIKWTAGALPADEYKKRTITKKYNDIKENDGKYFIYRHDDRKNETVHLMKLSSSDSTLKPPENGDVTYVEIKEITASEYNTTYSNGHQVKDGYKCYLQLYIADETAEDRIKEGIVAQQAVKEAIDNAGGEVYIMLDKTTLNYSNEKYPTLFNGVNTGTFGGINSIKKELSQLLYYNPYRYSGFRAWGLDTYGRYLGTPYVKQNGKWINLSKLVIGLTTLTEINPDYGSTPLGKVKNNYASKVFNLESYNYENYKFADVVKNNLAELDDRRKVQKEIFGTDFDKLREWTVGIGDSFFFVPPTSIKTTTSVQNEKISTIRSKGSIVKGGTKTERLLELELYFNDAHGVNGVPYKTKTPKGNEITYYMNGLRALISQFKFTPFLPIENEYINQALNIEAVALVNMQISTMPGFPRCLMVRLVLQEFDYTAYMPELPIDFSITGKSEENYYNPFALTINYEVMRWYYQRPLLTGNAIRNYHAMSDGYIANSQSGKTALCPMMFNSSDVKFYVADEDHLKKMQQVIEKQMYNRKNYPTLSEKEKKLAEELSKILSYVQNIKSDPKLQDSLSSFNSLLSGGNKMTGAGTIYEGKVDRYFTTSIVNGKNKEVYSRDKTNKALVELSKALQASVNRNVKGKMINGIGAPRIAQEDKAVCIEVRLQLTTNSIKNKNQMTNLLEQAAADVGINASKFNIQKNEISIRLKAPYVADVTDFVVKDGFKFDDKAPDYLFMKECLAINKNGGSPNDDAVSEKENADVSARNLTYEDYDIGDVKIVNLTSSLGNTYTKYGINGIDGYSYQYLGGQDTYIEINMQTTNDITVGLIEAMPRIQAGYARDYRLVLPACPFKIDSELTRMMGVNEILIENVSVDTVPGQPGLRNVTISCISMDRTLRNKEGLKKVNEFYNDGSISNDNEAELQISTFFDVKGMLAKAEVYPDLELPTIKELEKEGFNFLRHKYDTIRSYPDPDFYFVYSHVLQSQIFRESILNYKNKAASTLKWVDEKGNFTSTKNSKYYGVKETEDKSESVKKAQKEDDIIKKGSKNSGLLQSVNKIGTDALEAIRASDDIEGWDVCESIKVMGMGSKYRQIVETYEKSEGTDKQGKWLYDKLGSYRSVSKEIEKLLNKPVVTSFVASVDSKGRYKNDEDTKKAVVRAAKNILQTQPYKQLFADMDININKLEEHIVNVIAAAACAKSSLREYGRREDNWYPNTDIYGYCLDSGQDSGGAYPTNNLDKIVEKGYEFSIYRFKLYTDREIREFGVYGSVHDLDLNGTSINTSRYLLDPYFRRKKVTLKEIEEHKRKCCSNIEYATAAFIRNCLLWFKKMIDEHVMPNMTYDAMNEDFRKTLKDYKTASSIPDVKSYTTKHGQGKPASASIKKEIEAYLDSLEDNENPVDTGKFFFSALVAATDDPSLIETLKNDEFEKLNGLLNESIKSSGNATADTRREMTTRRMLRALVGLKEIKKIEELGKASDDALTDYKKARQERKYIDAAEDPNQYIVHSFYDMTMNDMRGRMARAFPTFYMLLIDEGKEVGMWKLHDNFYNINSIAEISINKSRKIAADTCNIVMSNMFQTYTSDDEDNPLDYEYNYKDVFNSIFNPNAYYEEQEVKRMAMQPINKAKLAPGIRMHIRMGYTANAAYMPVVFNGKVAEVSAGEVVNIVGQGDGVELLNPITQDIDAEEASGQDKWYKTLKHIVDNGETPKNIIGALLNDRGGFWSNAWNKITNGYFRSYNAYGITHFGDPRYKQIFNEGETTQNIFEAISKPYWGDLGGISEKYASDEPPNLSIQLRGKTPWDVFHICASMSPDFVLGVAPFNMRSTLFHGHPRYYYAYDYVKDEKSGEIRELRKPYQQYHVFTSYSDIISNGITATSQNLATNASGSYTSESSFLDSEGHTDTLYVDWDIYPENQRSMVYDTGILFKGTPIVSAIPLLSQADKFLRNLGDDDSGKKLSWRATATGLKNSIKDMYDGELVTIGDPTVKPHDRAIIYDTYESMEGSCLVESVTHMLSPETGFVTTINPDCIATVDDRHELAVQSGIREILLPALSLWTVGVVSGGVIANRWMGPLADLSRKSVASTSSKIAEKSERMSKALKTIKKFATEKGFMTAEGTLVKGGPSGIAAAASLAVEYGITTILTKSVTNFIEGKMKNKEVLQIFPLKKHGKVLTAGLNGSKGSVYGSTTYNMKGPYDALFAALDTKTNKWPSWINGIVSFFETDEIKSLADKYARRGDSATNTNKSATTDEKMLQITTDELAKEESIKLEGARKILLKPRIDPHKDKKMFSKFYRNNAFLDTRDIESQKEITKSLLYIKNNEDIRDLINKKVVRLAWDEQISDKDSYTEMTFNINNKSTTVKAINFTIDGRDAYDIPFLRKDALELLADIVVKFNNHLYDSENETKVSQNECLIIHSALKVGDSKTMASTGYTFIIEAIGESRVRNALQKAFDDVDKDLEDMYTSGISRERKAFERKLNGTTLWYVSVYPES